MSKNRFPGQRSLPYASVSLLLLLGTGCTARLPEGLWSATKLPSVALEMRTSPEATPGIYQVMGQTSLPEQTQMRVLAVRYLHPKKQASRTLNPKPTYAILDYQTAVVSQGKWQARLNLWQVATDGRYQEAWQRHNPALGLTLEPDPEVVFLATLMPGSKTDLLQQLEQDLAQQGKKLDSSQVRSLPDGQRYVQTSQTRTIALPTGRTLPPTARAEDINGGWGNRFIMPPEPVNPTSVELPKERRTNAPMTSDEFLR